MSDLGQHSSNNYPSIDSQAIISQQDINNLFSAEFYKQIITDLKDEALAWRISYELGGERIYVPKNVKPKSVWYKFGKLFCEWLVTNYSGEQIVIPLGPASELKKRHQQAVSMAERGFSTNQIIKTLGYSYRSVQYKKAIAKENSQLRLFL